MSSDVNRLSRLLGATIVGTAATLFFYFALIIIQAANADGACETYPHTVPGADFEDVRGLGFENSYLNLGGSCTYYMTDGSVVHTREPGWWFSGTIVSFVAVLAGFAVLLVRRKGHSGWLYGLTALLAPPLGLLLSATAARRT